MDNKKIIITIPKQLKKDLSNTKALDGEENESFFQSIDLRNKHYLKGYFEGYKVLYFETLRRLYNPLNIFQRKAVKKELAEVKTKLLQFEKVFDEMCGENSFEEKGFFSLNLKTNVTDGNKLKLNKLDYFLFIQNELSNKNQDLENKNETIKNKIFTQINYITNIFQYEKNLVGFSILDRESIYYFLGKSNALNNYLFRRYFKDYVEYKEEIKERLDDENWKIKYSTLELLKIILEKEELFKFVLGLFKKEEIKKRLDDKELAYIRESTLELLKVIAEKDLEFVKDFKEQIKKRLDDEGWSVNSTLALLKVIAEKDLEFVLGLFKKEEIKKRLDDEAVYTRDSTLELLKVIAEKDLEFVLGLFKKEEIKKRLDDEYWSVINSTLELLKVIAEKDLEFVLGLFKKEQIKKRLDDENWIVINSTLELLKVIAEKDLEFVKDFKEQIKKRLDDENRIIINSTLELLKVIAEKDLEFVKDFKEQIKKRLDDENWIVINSTLELLKVIAEKDLEFVKDFKEQIKKRLDDEYWSVRNSTLALLKVIAEKDLEFVKDFKEQIKKRLDDEYWIVINSTLELLKVIAEKDLEFVKKVLSFKNNNNFSNQIKDFIQNHTSGSCLLSGYRGVGKTSTISKSIYELQQESKNQEQKIIKIIVNIPELDDDKKLDKKSLIDRIVINTYREIDKIADIKDFKDEIKYLYTRIYNDVKNTTTNTKTFEGSKIDFNLINILWLVCFLLGGFILGMLIGIYLIKFGIFIDTFLSIGFIKSIFEIEYIKSLLPIIAGFAGSGLLYKKWKTKEEHKQEINEIYTPEIAENKLVNAINKLFKDKKYKIVFVIDELDKLLDFDKVSNSENTQKQKIDMKQVFDVLGKLKTLFFESKGAIFFVVTNKESYDYYLLNKHQEDDMISNIFNKIIYLPANSLDDFHIHHNVKITGLTKQKDTKKEDEENDENNSNIELREKIKNYIYFKSHGNWRKSKFELSQMITGDTIEIDQDKFDFEYKFYEFFVKIYKTFEKGSIENEKSKEHLQEFLFNTNGQANRLFEDTKKIEQKQNTEDKNDIDLTKIKELLGDEFYNIYLKKLEVKKESKENIQKLSEDTIDELFYKLYLQKIKELIISKKNAFGIKEENITVIEYIDFMIKNFTDNEKIHKRKFFGYFVASIETISLEYAYRDYIMNNLLNIFENINFLRKTTLDEVLKNIKINKDDLEYPAFKDMMIFWLPVMIIYFNNTEAND